MADALRVLVACEFSGTVRRAFAALGHDAKHVPGFEGYAVNPDGKVWSCRTARGFRAEFRPMTPRVDKKGYGAVVLCATNGVRRSVRIHRLIAEIFIPNPLGLPCVRHMDGSTANNSAANLAWGTYADNENDKRSHGTYETRRNGKLSASDRATIFGLYKSGIAQKEIARRFSVSRPTVTRLLNGATWGGQ